MSAGGDFLRGEAEARQDAWNRAARAYLDAFTAAPSGAIAPAALMALGRSLGRLGQTEEACLTLAEVGTRYPGDAAVAAAEAAIGLAILVCFFRNRGTIAVEDVNVMKG